MKTLISFLLCFSGLIAIAPEKKKPVTTEDRSYNTEVYEAKRKADKVTSQAKALVSELELMVAEKKYKKQIEDNGFQTIE